MNNERKEEIRRRARTDAQALRSGWPVQNPYCKVEESLEWQKQLDLALAELKK